MRTIYKYELQARLISVLTNKPLEEVQKVRVHA